jgi:hypothetical protein
MRKVKEETEAVGRGIREGRQRNNAPNKTGSRGAGVQKVGHMTRWAGLPTGVQGAGTNDDQLQEGWRPTWPPSRRRQDSTPHASTLTHSTAKTGAAENRRVSFPIMAFFLSPDVREGPRELCFICPVGSLGCCFHNNAKPLTAGQSRS